VRTEEPCPSGFLEAVVRFENSTNDDAVSSTAENISLDAYLQYLLLRTVLANPGIDPSDCLRPVRRVRPCESCGMPVAIVRLGRETRTVDCYPDEVHSSPLRLAWQADVVHEHTCMRYI